MQFLSRHLMAVAAFCVAAWGGPSSAQILSSFDADTEGWLTYNHNTSSWEAGAGNPGGCLLLEDRTLGAAHHTWAAAPPKFLGDWSSFGAGDSLVYDLIMDNITEGAADTTAYRVWISGPGGQAKAINGPAGVPPDSIWTTFAVPFDESEWIVEWGSWSALLADVTELRIDGEYVVGLEEVHLDNVRLTSTPVPVANTCVSEAFNTAGTTEDFTFGGVDEAQNISTEGNGGGFARITDLGGPNSYGYAPSRFLGDWRPYVGTHRITVDIRVITAGTTNAGSPDFIRISGPGGAAYVSLAPADIPDGLLMWRTFEFPIDSLAWTMESGTWSGLLEYVQECRIDLEYYGGIEVIGMDNFGRIAEECGWIDNPVHVDKPDFWFRGYHSLITPSSCVFNPVDSLIYGVVATTTGGLYYASGPNAGARLAAYDRATAALADDDGDMYVSLATAGTIYRIAYGGASSLWVSGFHSGDDDPVGMAFAPPGFDGTNVSPGDIIVVDIGNTGPDEIWTFSPDVAEGELLLVPDVGTFDWIDVASSAAGDVYVADHLVPDSLFVLHPEGTLTGLAIAPPLHLIVGIAYDDIGHVIYAADDTDKAIYRINLMTGQTTKVFSGFADFAAACVDIDSGTRRLFVADVGYHRIYELEISPLTGVEDQTPRVAQLDLRVVPNPFNPSTRIYFSMVRDGLVRLDIYDVAGRRVRRLFDGRMGEGVRVVEWDGRNERGLPVASGVYFAKLTAESATASTRMVLLK